jgi:hypothetical protein
VWNNASSCFVWKALAFCWRRFDGASNVAIDISCGRWGIYFQIFDYEWLIKFDQNAGMDHCAVSVVGKI